MRGAPLRRTLSSSPRGRCSSSSSSRGALPAAAAPRSRRLVAVALSPTSASTSAASVPALKADLLSALVGCGRGGSASAAARGAIEEAVLALEAAFALADEGKEREEGEAGEDGGGRGVSLLPGRWRLVYTTALDVAPLLAASEAAGSLGSATASAFLPGGLPFPRVAEIYQEFDPLPPAGSSSSFAPVRNVITFRLPPLLDSLTATVSARYEARARRRLRLVFDRAALGKAVPSRAAEALLAPALLPRGDLQKDLLLFLRSAEVGVPLSAQGVAASSPSGAVAGLLGPLLRPARVLVDRVLGSARDAAGGEYLLSFLDETTLIGRQTAGGGGVFVFARDDEKEEGEGE